MRAHVDVSLMNENDRCKAMYTGIALRRPGTVVDLGGFVDAYGIEYASSIENVLDRLEWEGITSWCVDTSLPKGSAEVLVRTDYVHEWE